LRYKEEFSKLVGLQPDEIEFKMYSIMCVIQGKRRGKCVSRKLPLIFSEVNEALAQEETEVL
jgi:hypothetical protein